MQLTTALSELLHLYNIDLRPNQRIDSDAELTWLKDHLVLATKHGLRGPELNVAIGVQISRYQLGYLFQDWRSLSYLDQKRQYRHAYTHTANTLIDDQALGLAERCCWDAVELADACNVTPRLATHRLGLHLRGRGVILPFINPFDDKIWGTL